MRSELFDLVSILPASENTMQIDILKTGQANFLELANTANGQTLTADQMTIGAPVVYSDDTDVNPRNTQVTISALPGSLEFKGSQTLRYTRLSLADLLADYEFQIGRAHV